MYKIGKEFAAPRDSVLIASHAVQRVNLVGDYNYREIVDYVMCVWELPEAPGQTVEP